MKLQKMWTILAIVLCYSNVVMSDGKVEVGTPENSASYRKIGHLYSPVKVGHIRQQVDLNQVRGITTTICSHVTDLEPFLDYKKSTV